jgi:hypothetical protein
VTPSLRMTIKECLPKTNVARVKIWAPLCPENGPVAGEFISTREMRASVTFFRSPLAPPKPFRRAISAYVQQLSARGSNLEKVELSRIAAMRSRSQRTSVQLAGTDIASVLRHARFVPMADMRVVISFREIGRSIQRHYGDASSSSSALASLRTGVSKPSVNQP